MDNKNLYYVSKDVLIHFSFNHPLVSNVRSREHVSVSTETLEKIGRFSNGATEQEWINILNTCEGKDRTRPTFGENGLHEDPSFILLDTSNKESKIAQFELKGKELFNLLLKRHILIKNENEYLSFFKTRETQLDFNKMGSFHEKVGENLLKNRIIKKWEWWHNQKFSEDGKEIKNPFYKAVQGVFIENYFKNKIDLKEKKVLDFGCGNGYFANLMAKYGGCVLGVDTDEDLIKIAKKNSIKGTEFILETNNSKSTLFETKTNYFDIIFMQDVLSLLLDHSFLKKDLPENTDIILDKIFKSLKPNGLLLCMDPNPTYWLAVRLGAKNLPIAVSTEYRNKTFNTTPNHYEVVNTLSKYGLGLIYWCHPQSDGHSENDSYNNQYAIWDFMVYRKF